MNYKQKYWINRRSIYASVNSRKGAFMNLITSKLLKEEEQESIYKIIAELEVLRLKIKSNNQKISM